MKSVFYQVVIFFIFSSFVFVSCNKDNDEPFDVNIDFQDVNIPNGKYLNDAGGAGFFQKGIVSLQNTYVYDAEYDYSYWYGFAYSQMHDVETSGWENEFSAYVLKDLPENKFMVGYFAPWEASSIDISFSDPVKDLSFDIANTTYTALAMKNGDAFTKKFTTSNDWLMLTIKAISTEGTETITMNLGKGVEITNVWNNIPVKIKNVTKLEFSLTSSDDGVPTYFCIDNIKARTEK